MGDTVLQKDSQCNLHPDLLFYLYKHLYKELQDHQLNP